MWHTYYIDNDRNHLRWFGYVIYLIWFDLFFLYLVYPLQCWVLISQRALHLQGCIFHSGKYSILASVSLSHNTNYICIIAQYYPCSVAHYTYHYLSLYIFRLWVWILPVWRTPGGLPTILHVTSYIQIKNVQLGYGVTN